MSPPEHHHSSRDREIITKDRAEQELSLIQAFIITPSCADINPNQSLTFNISFNPKQSSRNFLTELEGYVYFKNQRTFRLVNDYSLVPPWCVTVACMGHTFESGQLLAKVRKDVVYQYSRSILCLLNPSLLDLGQVLWWQYPA